MRTPVGLALAPVQDGEVLKPEEFNALPGEEKERRKATMEALQGELEASLHEVPKWEKEQREQIKALNREVTTHAVGFLIDELKRGWADQPRVLDYLEAVRRDVVDNAGDFLPEEQAPSAGVDPALRRVFGGEASFRRYRVNLLVDNGPSEAGAERSGAPVVDEDNPTLPNLVGRIEHLSRFGTPMTDLTLIKPGALAPGQRRLPDRRRAQAADPAVRLGEPEAGPALAPHPHRDAGRVPGLGGEA